MSFLSQRSRIILLRLFYLCSVCWCFFIVSIFQSPGYTIDFLEDFLINEQLIEPSVLWPSRKYNLNNQVIINGIDTMKKSNVTFLGVVRNIGPNLSKSLKQVCYISINSYIYQQKLVYLTHLVYYITD